MGEFLSPGRPFRLPGLFTAVLLFAAAGMIAMVVAFTVAAIPVHAPAPPAAPSTASTAAPAATAPPTPVSTPAPSSDNGQGVGEGD